VIRAWLFDLDDTLVSSSRVWKTAETELFRLFGASFDANLAQSYRGLNAEGVASAIYASVSVGRENAPLDRFGCVAFLRRRLVELSRTESREIDGAGELLRRTAKGRLVGISSGSPKEVIESVATTFAWHQMLAVMVSSEEVPAGKPAPDVYLETARRLGLVPDECLVVEDSLPGVRSAAAAGMPCIAVPSVDDTSEMERIAVRTFRSLSAVDPDEVERALL
jgi:beta-phosphoglucomutase-like phosphatase (HAD superfamily)